MLVPGIGMFSFGKSKTESRITGEFYVNAIHVMEGASGLRMARPEGTAAIWSSRADLAFQVHTNYVALPAPEAFGSSIGNSKRQRFAASRRKSS